MSDMNINDIPPERRHGLVCKRTGGALFPQETGVKPVVVIRAEMDGEEHAFIIDLRDAEVIKRVTEKLKAMVG